MLRAEEVPVAFEEVLHREAGEEWHLCNLLAEGCLEERSYEVCWDARNLGISSSELHSNSVFHLAASAEFDMLSQEADSVTEEVSRAAAFISAAVEACRQETQRQLL